MRIEQLRYLSDIQNTHSISKTAKRFFVSQQAMSNSLKQLESELKITLFGAQRLRCNFDRARWGFA